MARKKTRKKHATVLVLISGRETTHRGATLKQALKTAERSRLGAGCHVKWSKTYRLPSKKVAGGEGPVVCRGEKTGTTAFWMGVRTNPKGWRRGHTVINPPEAPAKGRLLRMALRRARKK